MRTNDLFLTAAAASMMMFAACTHDDGTTSISEPTPVGNEILITTRTSEMGITRADMTENGTTGYESSRFQDTYFYANQYIDVFMRDASGIADTTAYDSPVRYITTDANTYGNRLATYTYTGTNPRVYSTTAEVRPLYWPKLLHKLNIFGVYPVGAVGFSKKKTSCDNVANYSTPVLTTDQVFNKDFEYYFEVQEDQELKVNYNKSDLMIGLPEDYTVNSSSQYTPPFTLTQVENPGTIPLKFKHSLTKIIVNVTTSKDTKDIALNTTDPSKDYILYTGEGDTRWAQITLLNTKRKTWFKLYGDITPTPKRDVVTTDRASHVGEADHVFVGKGRHVTTFTAPDVNTGTETYTALSLAAIVPPQTVPSTKSFIKVDLYGPDPNNASNSIITETFLYQLTSDLTLEASKVYTFNIRINKPNIVVNATITDWVNGTGSPYNEVGVLQ